jgi:hypothetical protein
MASSQLMDSDASDDSSEGSFGVEAAAAGDDDGATSDSPLLSSDASAPEDGEQEASDAWVSPESSAEASASDAALDGPDEVAPDDSGPADAAPSGCLLSPDGNWPYCPVDPLPDAANPFCCCWAPVTPVMQLDCVDGNGYAIGAEAPDAE